MATLHIRGVPDELYERVRQLAQMRRRSLTDEIVYLLEQALADESLRQEQSDLLDSIGQQCYTPPPGMDSLTMLREGRERCKTEAKGKTW